MVGNGKAQKERYWQGLVAEWRASSLSVNEFCRRKGIAPASFWYWKKRSGSQAKGSEAAVFLPIRLPTGSAGNECSTGIPASGSIEILISGRYPVRVSGEFAPAVLDSVINVLENRAC